MTKLDNNWCVTPVLSCADVQATLDWYRDVLGFELSWTWDNDDGVVGDAGMHRGGAGINFMLNAELAARIAGSEVMVFLSGIDALHREHTAKGAEIVSPLTDCPWGLREYTVRDPNGYLLRFAEPVEAVS